MLQLPPIIPTGAIALPVIPTEWFPITTDPVWPGVYEVDDGTGAIAQFEWDGKHWLTANAYENVVEVDNIDGTEKWRGVRL